LQATGHTSISSTKNIVVDTLAPIISVTSHSSGQMVTGSTITLQGTVQDANFHTLFVNQTPVSVSGNQWSVPLSLQGGNNVIQLQAYDLAGNKSQTGMLLYRTLSVPATVSFPSQSNVALTTVVTSNQVTISGINIAVPLSIQGGLYRINT
jgi:hypothetical protein